MTTTDQPASQDTTLDALSSLVADEDRMAIMQVLWDAFEFQHYMVGESVPVEPNHLLEVTQIGDRATLDTHLDRLEGRLLEARGDGFVLTPLGYNLMRTFETFTDANYLSIVETETGDDCPFCGEPLFASYGREILHARCYGCGGLGGHGSINYVAIPATSATNLDLDGLLDVAAMELTNRVRFSRTGLCPTCYADIDRTVQLCDTHERGPTGICDTCETRFNAEISANCPECGWGGIGPLVEYALLEPTAVHQYERDHGLTVFHRGPWRYRLDALSRVTESIHPGEPTRCVYEFDYDEPVIVEFAIATDGTLKHA